MIEAGGLVILFDRLFLIIGGCLEPPPSPLHLAFTFILDLVLSYLVPRPKPGPGTWDLDLEPGTWDLQSWSCLEPQSAFDALPGSNSHLGNCTPGQPL